MNPLPALGVLLGILFALAIPALIRELRRRQMLAAARSGDAAAAWSMVQDAAIDLGIAVPASETPRTLGTRLVERARRAADGDEAARQRDRARELRARRQARDFWQGDAIADAATPVRARACCASVDAPRRLLALLVPRSLISGPARLRRVRGAAGPRKVGWSAARQGHGGFA